MNVGGVKNAVGIPHLSAQKNTLAIPKQESLHHCNNYPWKYKWATCNTFLVEVRNTHIHHLKVWPLEERITVVSAFTTTFVFWGICCIFVEAFCILPFPVAQAPLCLHLPHQAFHLLLLRLLYHHLRAPLVCFFFHTHKKKVCLFSLQDIGYRSYFILQATRNLANGI